MLPQEVLDSALQLPEVDRRLIEALEEVIESSAISLWLTAPNAAFDGLKPLEVIDRGEIDRIWQMIYQLRSGVAF